MSVIQSRINTRDPAFAANREHMQAQVDDLRSVVDDVVSKSVSVTTSRFAGVPSSASQSVLDAWGS